jgi:hypothetical protein
MPALFPQNITNIPVEPDNLDKCSRWKPAEDGFFIHVATTRMHKIIISTRTYWELIPRYKKSQ